MVGIKTYIKTRFKRRCIFNNNLMEYIEQNEGRKNYLYKCTSNKTTFGVGHNFSIKQDEELIDLIFEYDYKKIIKSLNYKNQFNFNFNKQPVNVRIVLTDMTFQMGITGLKKFKKMLLAIELKDYGKASKELLNSKYAKQTPNRAKRNSELLKNSAKI